MNRGPHITNKFVAFPTQEVHERNQLSILDLFLMEYGDKMHEIVKVTLHDGSKVVLGFDKRRKLFFGMKSIYIDNPFEVGYCLLFEYFARSHFIIYMFSNGGTEIVNGTLSQVIDDSVLTLKGVTKFEIQVDCTRTLIDITLPEAFVEQSGHGIPSIIFVVLNNGQCFEGRFCIVEIKLHCFCDVMHLISFGKSTRLIFSYNGQYMFYVSVFDTDGIERSMLNIELKYPGYKTSNEIEFEIEIKKSHLLEYCHGVYIHCNFRNLTDHWRNGSKIVAYHENLSWQIEVKRKKKKVTLHQGWIYFWKDMNLEVGDICFFRMRECFGHFDEQVLRKEGVDV